MRLHAHHAGPPAPLDPAGAGRRREAASQVVPVPAGQDGTTDHRLGDEVSLGGGESDGQDATALVPRGGASDKVWVGGSAVALPRG